MTRGEVEMLAPPPHTAGVAQGSEGTVFKFDFVDITVPGVFQGIRLLAATNWFKQLPQQKPGQS